MTSLPRVGRTDSDGGERAGGAPRIEASSTSTVCATAIGCPEPLDGGGRPASGSRGWRSPAAARRWPTMLRGLAVAELAGRLGVEDVVDAGRAAADLRLGDLPQLQPGDAVAAARAAGRGCPGRARGGRRRGRRRSSRSGCRGATGPSSARISATSRTLSANASRPLGVRRVVGQQVGVLLHRRAAAGGVDDDALDAGGLEGVDQLRGRTPAPPPPGRCAPTARRSSPAPAGTTTSQPSAGSTRAVAALTPGKNSPCTQPVSRPTTARRSPVAGMRCGQRLGLAERRARGVSIAASCGRQPLEQPGAAQRAVEPGAPGSARSGPRSAAAACGYGNSAKISPRSALSVRGAVVVALDLGAGRLDELVVLHAGRAGGHAGHAAEAGVEVRDHRVASSARPRGPASSGRSGRAGSPSPRPTARTSGRSAGRTRSARSRRSSAASGGWWSSKAPPGRGHAEVDDVADAARLAERAAGVVLGRCWSSDASHEAARRRAGGRGRTGP